MITTFLRLIAQARDDRCLETVLLEHGQAWPWEPGPLPTAIRRGRRRECYRNALMLTISDRSLVYVEGWALMPECGVPIHHAWCVNTTGRVIDPTWHGVGDDLPGREYFGIAFAYPYVARCAVNRPQFSLLYAWRYADAGELLDLEPAEWKHAAALEIST